MPKHDPAYTTLSALILCIGLLPTVTLAKPTSTLFARAVESTCACEHELSTGLTAAFGILIPILVVCSGITAGLTLGYMSLDTTQLQVLAKTGTEKQKRLAQKIIPVRKDGHLLLVTLLISNMTLNETLPVIFEKVLGGGFQAVAISTVLIVIFSEIIPQSVCSRFGLEIGAACVVPVRILIYIFYIVSWPVSKILEWALGPHSGVVYRRAELKELVAMHTDRGGHGGDLNQDTVTIIGATLDLQEKVVKQIMTPIADVFMLHIDARLDFETLGKVLHSGHSRIPVYELVESNSGKVKKIVGALLTKQFILLDPEDAIPVRDIPIHPLPPVPDDLPLLNILNTFQEGRSHMAIVYPRRSDAMPPSRSSTFAASMEPEKEKSLLKSLFKREEANDEEKNKDQEKLGGRPHLVSRSSLQFLVDESLPQGIVTIEDVIEELIGEEILDEFDTDPTHPRAATPYIPEEAAAFINGKKPISVPVQATKKSGRLLPIPSPLNLLGSRSGTPTGKKAPVPEKSNLSTEPPIIDIPVTQTPEPISTPPVSKGAFKSASDAFNRLGITRSRSAPGTKRTLAPAAATTRRDSDSHEQPDRGMSLPDPVGHLELIAEKRSREDELVVDTQEDSSEGLPTVEEPINISRSTSGRRYSMDDRATAPLLSDAILLERGRRHLRAQGQNPEQMNLRLATPQSQLLRASAPPTAGTTTPTAHNLVIRPGSASSTGPNPVTQAKKTFKTPASSSALPAHLYTKGGAASGQSTPSSSQGGDKQ